MLKRVIITSGPTVEPIDPVRFVSNRSSGKSGLHLANEAKKRDIGEIIYITGPTCFLPEGVTVVQVETALEMQEQLGIYAEEAGVVIMAAAVSDYRLETVSPQKIKKTQQRLTLNLVKNPDLLFELGQRKGEAQVLVGYAAETDNIFENARKKFERKNLDLLVLNEISEGNPAFNADCNQVYFFTAQGERKLESMEKANLAVYIFDEIFRLAAQKKNSGKDSQRIT